MEMECRHGIVVVANKFLRIANVDDVVRVCVVDTSYFDTFKEQRLCFAEYFLTVFSFVDIVSHFH